MNIREEKTQTESNKMNNNEFSTQISEDTNGGLTDMEMHIMCNSTKLEKRYFYLFVCFTLKKFSHNIVILVFRQNFVLASRKIWKGVIHKLRHIGGHIFVTPSPFTCDTDTARNISKQF